VEACFIGPGRRWGGGETAGGSGLLIPVGFKGVKGGEETGRRRLHGELEGDDPTLRFDFTRVHSAVVWTEGRRRHGWKQPEVGDERGNRV
jgi:hypothetical protein